MMFPIRKKMVLTAVALGFAAALSSAAAAAERPEPPGSVLAENGEHAYLVSKVVIVGNKRHTEEEIRRLVPEANRPLVRPARLSKQLALLNDGQVMKIEAMFTPSGDREYTLLLAVEEVKNDHFAINVNNTGNDYTGDWRAGVSYMNTDLTKHGDALGLAYTTNPGKHIDDVIQAAVTYKAIFPHSGDTMYFTYSYSDVDMGTIASFGGLNIVATGQGHTASAHYQRNMVYTRARRQTLDFGFDYKHYKNSQDWIGLKDSKHSYNVGLFSATYHDLIRRGRDAFAWSIGWTTNLVGDKDDYHAIRAGSDTHFNIFRLDAAWQRQTQNDWLLNARAYGQWTNDDLIPSEMLGGGGFGSVRGFYERVAVGDKGLGGTFEIATPKWIPDTRLVAFFDAAYLANNTVNLGEEGHRNLAAFGAGVRYGSEKLGLYASLFYAKPVSYGGLNGKHTRPWTFFLTKTF